MLYVEIPLGFWLCSSEVDTSVTYYKTNVFARKVASILFFKNLIFHDLFTSLAQVNGCFKTYFKCRPKSKWPLQEIDQEHINLEKMVGRKHKKSVSLSRQQLH